MKINKDVLLFGLAAATLLALALNDASAANRWYTARTINGRTQPLSAGTEAIALSGGSMISTKAAAVTNGLIDMVISLYNSPAGDDDGNTQDVDPGSMEQDAYEKIIQYFADGVYESTEGVHSIRNVRIYRNASRPDADVIWKETGGPRAGQLNQSGIAASIKMFNHFSGHAFTNAASQEVGGYALAHEFGHYFYGLYDEYCRWGGGTYPVSGAWTNLAGAEKTRPCMMNHQWSAANRDYRWLNHSIHYDTNAAGFVDYECRPRTAECQFYGDGGWPVLSRNPTNDPLDTGDRQGGRNTWGVRMYYPELAAVAPAGMNPPRIDLSAATPLTNLASRAHLNVVWMGTNIAMMIILDKSGSMGLYDRLENAKTAAKLLVEQLANGSGVGVVAFNHEAQVVTNLTIITNTAQRLAINNAIDAITNSGWSAIGDAAAAALNQFTAFGGANFTRTAFLLSDGQSNIGSDPLAAAAGFQTAQVPIMTFGFGDMEYIDSRLPVMALMTGGRNYYSPDSLVEITAAFQDAFAEVAARQNLANGRYLAAPAFAAAKSSSINIPFQVDITIADIAVTAGYSLSNAVALTLNAPDGTVYQASSTNQNGTERVLNFSVGSPAAGEWRITGTAADANTVRYQVNAGASGFTYYLAASSMDGSVVTSPAPLRIAARLSRGTDDIKGAVIHATVTDPNGNTTNLTMEASDDGTTTWFRMFTPSCDGLYDVVVSADNSAGTAFYTWGSAPPPLLESDVIADIPPDQPLTDMFTRTAAFQVTVTGVVGTAAAPAAPAGIAASDGEFSDYVNVAWTAAANASLYEIWRSDDASSGHAVKIGEVDRAYLNYIDASVTDGSRYYYWVKAVNYAGASAFSSVAQGWPMFGPAVRVNNAHSLTMARGNTAVVSVLLKTGSYAGLNCDWWVVAYDENAGVFYYLDGSLQWQAASGMGNIRPVYTGPVFEITDPFTVLTSNGLSTGTYRFYFGLDTNADGIFNADAIYYDMAVLNIL